MNHTPAQAQAMCQSQLRAIMTADDEFGATMQLLSDRGVLDNTLVIFSSDNGYMWGEHGRWEKFVPYEPSIRVPLLVRWPGHFAAGTRHHPHRLLPRPAADDAGGRRVHPARQRPALDGESLLAPVGTHHDRTPSTTSDTANGNVPTWKMVRTAPSSTSRPTTRRRRDRSASTTT